VRAETLIQQSLNFIWQKLVETLIWLLLSTLTWED